MGQWKLEQASGTFDESDVWGSSRCGITDSRGRETCLGTTGPGMKATGDDAGFAFLLRKQRRMRRADRSVLFIFWVMVVVRNLNEGSVDWGWWGHCFEKIQEAREAFYLPQKRALANAVFTQDCFFLAWAVNRTMVFTRHFIVEILRVLDVSGIPLYES